jgi:hypothetical protein
MSIACRKSGMPAGRFGEVWKMRNGATRQDA